MSRCSLSFSEYKASSLRKITPSRFNMRFPHIISTVLVVVTTLLVCCSTSVFVQANNYGGFTADLIHRDAPKSPFYDPLLTPSQRLKNTFRRSLDRANQFASASVIVSGGEYLMKISYGTPPFETQAVVNTADASTWTQCLPCTQCSQEKFPRFDPQNSSTYESVSCHSRTCDQFSSSMCTQDSSACAFFVLYGDDSNVYGELARETITLEGSAGDRVSFPDFIFGCGQGGDFPKEGSGIVGLGFQHQSLISQLNSSLNGKFSYCFGPSNDVSKPGKIGFGNNPELLGREGVVSTPLHFDFTYSLRLEAISVADTRLEYHYDTPSSTSGNIFIDSGTPYTFLPQELYSDFKAAIQREIGSQNIVVDQEHDFTLCYSSLLDSNIPNVTLHFTGADLKLNPENIFDRASSSPVCLGFAPNDIGILGNIAQANSWVQYDLGNKIISFKPADCTK
nr:aspartic proteinase CDR1-like [Coffea arabica]